MELTKEFEIVYHPNRRNLVAIPAGISAILAGLLVIWRLYVRDNLLTHPGITIFWVFLIICGIVYIVWIARSSKQMIRITEKGIALLNDGKDSVYFKQWTSLPCITQTKNIQRHRYLILSADKLSRKEAFLLTNRASITQNIRLGEVFVLWNNNTDTANQVFDYILKKAEEAE